MVDKSTLIRLALLTPIVLFLLYFGWFRDSASRDKGPQHWDLPPSSPPPADNERYPILAGYFPAW